MGKGSLRVAVRPGPVAVRVVKASSDSKTYRLILRGGNEDLRIIPDLPYEATITTEIPESQSAPSVPLYLYVVPD